MGKEETAYGTTTYQDSEIPSVREGAPTQISPRGWWAALKETVKQIKVDRVTFTAGALAYYWFLALFTALIALVGVVTLVQLQQSTINNLVKGIDTIAPGGVSQIFQTAITNATQTSTGGTTAVIIGLAVAVWSATSGMAALTTGLNLAYGVAEDRKLIPKRINAFVLMIAVLVLGGIALALIAFGPQIGTLIEHDVPVAGYVFMWVWTVVRWIVALLAISTLFSVIYYLGPKRPSPRWTWVSPGGIFGTAIWIAASLGFSFYTSSMGSYGKTYGAFAGVAVLILWLYITGLAVLIGAELNAQLEGEQVRTDSL